MECVPEPSPVGEVGTGDFVRFEITTSHDGYLTVLNLGSSGEVTVLFPDPTIRDNRILAQATVGEVSRSVEATINRSLEPPLLLSWRFR